MSSVPCSFRLLISEEIFGIQWVIVITHWIHRLLLWPRCHSLSSASLNDDPFFVGSPWASWRRLTEELCVQWLVSVLDCLTLSYFMFKSLYLGGLGIHWPNSSFLATSSSSAFYSRVEWLSSVGLCFDTMVTVLTNGQGQRGSDPSLFCFYVN